MSFSDYKISAFPHRISDLDDQPSLTPGELKARFDLAPEALRQSLNAVCDDAAALDDRVSNIISGAFGGTVSKSMLSTALQQEIDGKADDGANAAAHQTLFDSLAEKSSVVVGTYVGDGAETRNITLGFSPKAVLVLSQGGEVTRQNNCHGGLATPDYPCIHLGSTAIAITATGFTVVKKKLSASFLIETNTSGTRYLYLAFR